MKLSADVLAWRTGLFGLSGIVGISLLAEVSNWIPAIPTDVHIDLIALSLALTIGGGMNRLRRQAIAPVREAFLHGYALAKEHQAELTSTGDEARVLRMPLHAYAGELAPARVPTPRHRRQGRRPAPRNR